MGIEFKGDFFKKLQKIDNKYFLSKTISEAGVIAVRFSKDRFRQKNWVDKSQKSWAPRKRKTRGSLLVQSGRLKRSIRKISEGKYYVLIGTDVPYAQIHNEGGVIKTTARVRAHSRTRKGRSKPVKIRAHTRKMNTKIPQRHFLGESAVLIRRLENHLYKEVTNEIYKK